MDFVSLASGVVEQITSQVLVECFVTEGGGVKGVDRTRVASRAEAGVALAIVCHCQVR